MHITLIRPQFGSGSSTGYNSPARMEPLALAILKALTPKEISVAAYDERFETIDFEKPTDLVALSVCTFSAKRAYEISAEYRARGVTVVMGGFHPTLMPQEALLHADAVARGDAEYTWTKIIEDFRLGKLEKIYEPQELKPAPAVIPDRSIFKNKRYLPIRLVQYARGCNRTCEFCAIRAFYGGNYLYRSVAHVVEELKLTKAKRVFFVDDNIISNKKSFRDLLEAIVPLKLKWTTQIDISFADDPELLQLAVRSGCQSVVIGFESLNEKNLTLMKKGWNRAEDYSARLARIRAAGIMVYGTFVLGYDHDDITVFRKTLDFAIKEKMFIANFNPLQPFPGTPLYSRMKTDGSLLYEDWWLTDQYQWQQALLHPKGMTSDELTSGTKWCRKEFNSFPNILRRFFGSYANTRNFDNAGVFLTSNIISRLDILAKTGINLGKKGK